MSRYIDAETYITAEVYDDEHEEYMTERITIAEFLDRYTEEGCPSNDAEWKRSEGERKWNSKI